MFEKMGRVIRFVIGGTLRTMRETVSDIVRWVFRARPPARRQDTLRMSGLIPANGFTIFEASLFGSHRHALSPVDSLLMCGTTWRSVRTDRGRCSNNALTPHQHPTIVENETP
jgi:hypothetical protein